MTETYILEGNKLIGDFMGKGFKDPMNYMYDIYWDWLMPVVEKINSLSYNDSNNRFQPTVERFLENDINSIWRQVVIFLSWYDKNKPNA